MPNTGLPSRACEGCRQRRVTCDYGRPSCRRCERNSRSCFYRNLENPEPSFRIQTPASYRSQSGQQTESPNQQSRSGSQELRHSISPARALGESWDAQIIPLILSQFSFPMPGGGRFYGSLECFSVILPTVPPESLTRSACDAVGYLYFMHKTPSRDLTTRHQRAYGHALQQLRLAVDHPVAQRQDETLLAVWLLCLYELMLGTPPDAPGPGPSNWAAHSVALTGLLRSRGQQQFGTRTGCQLFQLCYHHIQTCALQSGTEPAAEAKQWFETIRTRVNTQDPLYLFLPFLLVGDEAAHICSSALSAWNRVTQAEERLEILYTVFHSARALEFSMHGSWERLGLPSDSPPSHSTTLNPKQRHLLLHIRNHIDTCILRIHSVLLDLLREAVSWPEPWPGTHEHLGELQQVCTEVAQECADRILSSVPQFLADDSGSDSPGWADALRLMWPARVILASPATQGRRADTAKEALRRIAYEVGIMQAVGSFFKPARRSLSGQT